MRCWRCRDRDRRTCSAELGLPTDMDYMGYADASFSGVPVRVCRTGYTGEHGYELLPPWESARRGVRRAGRGGQRGRR